MDSYQLKLWGVFFIIFGLLIAGVSVYFSSLFSLTILTEVGPGLFLAYMGVYLIHVANKQVSKEFDGDSGRASSPFYYELEPGLYNNRALPPIPKDIGREYDPVVMDKV